MATGDHHAEKAVTRNPIIVVIVVVAAALGVYDYWWIHQPPLDQPSYPIDVNTATVSELTTLPEVDESTAEKIVRERPYKRSEDLVQKNLISQETYDKIKHFIVAKQK